MFDLFTKFWMTLDFKNCMIVTFRRSIFTRTKHASIFETFPSTRHQIVILSFQIIRRLFENVLEYVSVTESSKGPRQISMNSAFSRVPLQSVDLLQLSWSRDSDTVSWSFKSLKVVLAFHSSSAFRELRVGRKMKLRLFGFSR